jgi:hypothetical protein
MGVASKQKKPDMECRFKRIPWAITLLLLSQILYGCITFRIEKVNDGADVQPLPQEFVVGKTTLTDVLASYGAPADIVDMKGHFALHYQRAFYRGGNLSLGLPLTDVLKVSPTLDATGNLQRYDSAVFVFTPEGVLSEMNYAGGTSHPFWDTYWK